MGFKLNTQHSDDFNICVETASLPGIASKRQIRQTVTGKDGEHIVEDGYNNIEITFKCSITDDSIALRRKNIRAIAAWLANIGDLIIDYEPDIIYSVVSQSNDVETLLRGWNIPITEFEVTFECLPYQTQTFYNDELTWDEAESMWVHTDVPWDGCDRLFEDVDDGDTLEVINLGTYKALPIIKLSGTASTVTIGDFTYAPLSGTVYIDCEEMEVYTLSGESKVNAVANFEGEFLELEPGTTELDVSGTITSLDVEFDYKNTYL